MSNELTDFTVVELVPGIGWPMYGDGKALQILCPECAAQYEHDPNITGIAAALVPCDRCQKRPLDLEGAQLWLAAHVPDLQNMADLLERAAEIDVYVHPQECAYASLVAHLVQFLYQTHDTNTIAHQAAHVAMHIGYVLAGGELKHITPEDRQQKALTTAIYAAQAHALGEEDDEEKIVH